MFFVFRSKYNRLCASNKFWKNAAQEWEKLADYLGDANTKLQKENEELVEDMADEQNISNDLRIRLKAAEDALIQFEREHNAKSVRDPKTGKFIRVSKPDNDTAAKNKSHFEGGF